MFEELKTKKKTPERQSNREGNFYTTNSAKPGMNDRIRALREESIQTPATLSIERALIETAFYKKYEGRYPVPVMRAMNFMEICDKKQIYIGEQELIVGERGERP